MIFIVFFLLLFSTEVYFSALIKSHLFDTNIEILSIQQMQTTIYIEGLCVYLGSIIADSELFKTDDNLQHTLFFAETYVDDHDSLRATVVITKETQKQFLLSIECVRSNTIQQYYARIHVEPASFSVITCNQSKKEFFQ